MLPTSHLLAFVVTAVIFVAIPGPSVLFVVSRSVVHGSASSPRRMAAIGGAGGLAMIAIGARLAFTGRND